MKKCLSFLLILALLLAGCTQSVAEAAPSTEAPAIPPQPQAAPPQPDSSSQASPEPAMGSRPGFNNGPMQNVPNSPAEVTQESLPPVEIDELFTERDLNQTPDLSEAISITPENNTVYTIDAEGIYIVSGQATDFTVKVEAGKKDKVQLVLDSVNVTNTDFPVIYVKSADKCFVTLTGSSNLTVSQAFTSDGDTNTDAVIFSKADLTLNGSGSLTLLSAAGNGIAGKDDLKITGGSCTVTAAKNAIEANDSLSIYDGEFTITAGKDGFHCENSDSDGAVYIRDGHFTVNAKADGIQANATLIVDGGQLQITAKEGLEATYVQINGGTVSIQASDDGINAAQKCSSYSPIIEINGGDITVVMGPGDTDGLDANGTIIVNGGTVNVTGQSAFDADLGSIHNGGTVIINGVETDTIPNSMMGGHGGGKGGWPQGDGGAFRPQGGAAQDRPRREK